MNERKHEDNGTRIAHEIEARLGHGDKVHSTLHDELHKLQKQDSHHGVVNSGKFEHDVHTVESKLHKDGYLPNLHISVDHKSHINLQHIKHHPKDPSKHPASDQNVIPNRDPNSGRDVLPYRDPNSERDFVPNRDPNSGRDILPYRKENPFHLPPNDQIGNRLVPFDQGGEPIKNSGEFREMHLENRSASHAGADALVYVRKDFDPSKPVHLVVYNHGFESTVTNALQRNQIKEMMSQAQTNTVLVLPEWQANPGSRSGQSGTFQQQDKFTKMVQEMMQKTPALRGASLDNVDRIDIIAHSAGYSPTEAEIYKNPAISGKVHSITLLDSLYDRHGFDKWLGDNLSDLSSGRKQFYNFSNSSTATNSREQAKLVASMLHNRRLPTNNYVADYGTSNGEVARHGAEMAERSIVFASTTTRHGEIPGKYIGATLAALNPERSQQQFFGS